MVDDKDTKQDDVKDVQDDIQDGGDTSDGTKNTDKSDADGDANTVPYDRFKTVNDRAKALEKKVAAFEKADADRKAADLTENEKLAAERDDLKAKAEAAEQRATSLLMEREFNVVAAKLKYVFESPQAGLDAFGLADLEAVEIDDSGKVTGMEGVVKAIRKERPYLFATVMNQDIDADKGGGNGKLTPEQENEKVMALKRRFNIR